MPAAPAAPSPVKEPPVTQSGPPPSEQETSRNQEEFAELDSLDDAPKPVKAPEKPKEQAKVESPKAPEKPKVEAPKVPEKPAEVEPKSIPEVRRAYDAKKKEIRDTWEPKVKALESELATLKSTSGNGAGEQVKSLTERLHALEKRNGELEGTIKFVDYRKSKDFTEKYEKPYNEAWASAIGELDELTVRVRTGVDDLGEAVYGERKATSNDMLTLANLPLGEARKLAKDMFGDNADDMMAHRRKIRELSDAQTKALSEAQKTALEADKAKTEQSQDMMKQTNQLWAAANKTLSEKYPKWFAPTEGDEEGNALLQKGFSTVDRMFNPTPETQPKTSQEAVALHALIRNKAANHDRLALGLRKATERITELETELKAFQDSEPKGGAAAPGSAGATNGDWRTEADAELDALNTD